jgi:hypothetical protein
MISGNDKHFLESRPHWFCGRGRHRHTILGMRTKRIAIYLRSAETWRPRAYNPIIMNAFVSS